MTTLTRDGRFIDRDGLPFVHITRASGQVMASPVDVDSAAKAYVAMYEACAAALKLATQVNDTKVTALALKALKLARGG